MAILSAYDDLIENNLRRIKILEEMAQNLYREWFVKFRFPGYQRVRFTDSPLGTIPEGWEVKSLGNICDQSGGCIRTGPFGSQLHQADYQEDGTPVVMPKNIIHGRISEEGIARIGEDDLGRLSQHRLLEGDIVYGRRGDIGRQALVCPRETGWLCGTGCLRISLGNSSLDPVYPHHYLDQEDVISGITNQAVGATMPNLNTSILRNVPILCPAEPLLKQFSKVAFETLAAADLFFSKNVNLRSTRDLLLPKLISGEVDVSDLAIAISEEADEPAEPVQDKTPPVTVAVRVTQMSLVAKAAEEPEAYEEEAPERRTAAVPVEEWDTDEVMAAFRQAARKTGITDRATLLKAVSAELGYERLGSRIKGVLQGRLRAAIRRKIIGTNGPEVWPETPTMDSYDRDTLIETLCSVMRMGTVYEREEVTRAVANHLGFRRLTDTVLAPIKSAINGAIRRGVLAYEGTMIWREQ